MRVCVAYASISQEYAFFNSAFLTALEKLPQMLGYHQIARNIEINVESVADVWYCKQRRSTRFIKCFWKANF